MESKVQQLFIALKQSSDATYEGVVKQCRILRELGEFYGMNMKNSDVPKELDEHYREHTAWQANMYARLPLEVFEKFLKVDGDLVRQKFCVNKVRKKAMAWTKADKAKKAALSNVKLQNSAIYQADISDVTKLKAGKSADAIITDPPYPFEYLSCWSELVKFAGRTLKPHGWLVAMSGQKYLPEVFQRMINEADKVDLHYVWTLALHVPGECVTTWMTTPSKDPSIAQKSINTQWKPIIVFVKKSVKESNFTKDFIISPANDKEHHFWGQNEEVFEKLVTMFSEPKDLVVDPFIGGGTTAIAALKNKRKFEGFDISEESVTASHNRIAAAQGAETR